jgi:hypothetical protein
VLVASIFLCSGNAFAQAVDKEPEPAAIVELGGAGSRDLKGGGSSYGADLAVEATPIEAAFHPPLDGVGHRLPVQKAVDPLEKSGVHDRRRS